jgi:hypothetical protein
MPSTQRMGSSSSSSSSVPPPITPVASIIAKPTETPQPPIKAPQQISARKRRMNQNKEKEENNKEKEKEKEPVSSSSSSVTTLLTVGDQLALEFASANKKQKKEEEETLEQYKQRKDADIVEQISLLKKSINQQLDDLLARLLAE